MHPAALDRPRILLGPPGASLLRVTAADAGAISWPRTPPGHEIVSLRAVWPVITLFSSFGLTGHVAPGWLAQLHGPSVHPACRPTAESWKPSAAAMIVRRAAVSTEGGSHLPLMTGVGHFQSQYPTRAGGVAPATRGCPALWAVMRTPGEGRQAIFGGSGTGRSRSFRDSAGCFRPLPGGSDPLSAGSERGPGFRPGPGVRPPDLLRQGVQGYNSRARSRERIRGTRGKSHAWRTRASRSRARGCTGSRGRSRRECCRGRPSRPGRCRRRSDGRR